MSIFAPQLLLLLVRNHSVKQHRSIHCTNGELISEEKVLCTSSPRCMTFPSQRCLKMFIFAPLSLLLLVRKHSLRQIRQICYTHTKVVVKYWSVDDSFVARPIRESLWFGLLFLFLVQEKASDLSDWLVFSLAGEAKSNLVADLNFAC